VHVFLQHLRKEEAMVNNKIQNFECGTAEKNTMRRKYDEANKQRCG
jgi:hypothetical protein